MLKKFFSSLSSTSPRNAAHKNFDRARRAELRRDIEKAREYTEQAAIKYDELATTGKEFYPGDQAMAGILFTKLGRHDEARALLASAIKARPRMHEAYAYLGHALIMLGELDEARRVFESFPSSSGDIVMHRALAAQAEALAMPEPDLDAICEALVLADFEQARKNKQQQKPFGLSEHIIKSR